MKFINIPLRFIRVGYKFSDDYEFIAPDTHTALNTNQYSMDPEHFRSYHLSGVSLHTEIYDLLNPYDFKIFFNQSFPAIFETQGFSASLDISDNDLLLLKLSMPS